eukprot:scaffold19541_cov35-Cyclotella_meneghiniana.AAC.2
MSEADFVPQKFSQQRKHSLVLVFTISRAGRFRVFQHTSKYAYRKRSTILLAESSAWNRSEN